MFICGIDEVGRGALAGPLMAVATAFKIPHRWADWSDYETDNSPIAGVNDSKKLTQLRRKEVFHRILRWESLVSFGLGEVSAEEINLIGIDRANNLAFERCVKDLGVEPNYILIDGDTPLFGWDMTKQHHEPRADGRFWPVGAASILAKVIRDEFMTELGKDFPYYKWDSNAGYGSKDHQEAIQRMGPCCFHRTQFIRKLWRAA